jgi:hypothetical protein
MNGGDVSAGRGRHSRESGFALLFVFLLAALIAIGLYVEIPRVVFEGQRIQEQTLIDRGHQYQRAIQLYFRKFRGTTRRTWRRWRRRTTSGSCGGGTRTR